MATRRPRAAKSGPVKLNVRKGDEVQVIRGKGSGRKTRPEVQADKGEKQNPVGLRGRVRRVLTDSGRLIVEGVRKGSKAMRPDPRKGIRGGFMEQERSLPASCVMLVCARCDRPVRVRFEKREGKRTRLCRRCGEAV